VVQIVLWYLDSGCSKHMTGDRSQLINFVQKFLGMVKFGNDHVAKIMGYGDYQIGNVTISRFIQKKHEEEQAANARYWKILACCDDDDDYNFAITPNEPVDSLSMGDEHLSTILATESDEFIKFSVENLVTNPSESEDENDCDMPACFTTFSNILFDADYEFDSSDDQSFDSLMEEIDLSFTPDDPVPLGIEEDDDDSKRDILILKELLDNYSLSLPEIESYHFDITSFSHPPAKPPDGNTGILNIKMMGDIFEQKNSYA
nr:integrase, catalytic region, zinc finger, CCHC-type, peptidase aspartic, catalytic [Tanacetum cinerariifolium]